MNRFQTKRDSETRAGWVSVRIGFTVLRIAERPDSRDNPQNSVGQIVSNDSHVLEFEFGLCQRALSLEEA